MRKTLLFGIGAAKAGTTWLYRYLARHPDCRLPAVKELHYFDTCESGEFARQVKRMRTELGRRVTRLPTGNEALDKRLNREISGYQRLIELLQGGADDEAYLDFVKHRTRTKRLFGDITPAYATLRSESYARMAQMAPRVRFVFLMRDPLQRLWSNIRMDAERSGGDLAAEAERLLTRCLAGEDATMAARSDYASTLARLDAVVPGEQIFIGLYEELFRPETLQNLCKFLAIREHKADFEARVLQGQSLAISPEQRARALDWLAPQYEAVEARLGRLPAGWTRL